MKLFARIFIGLSILSGYDSYSQTARTLTGIVTSVDERAPLEGVTVTTKDGTNISGTQADGIYYITITPTDSILVFSYADFQTEEIKISAGSEYNVVLKKRQGIPVLPVPLLSLMAAGGVFSGSGIVWKHLFFLK